MIDWRGRSVLVTGASAGLGFHIAEAFAMRGAKVAIAARGQAKLDDAAARLRMHGATVLPIAADVTRQAEVDSLVNRTVLELDGLDVLVNNAGRSTRGKALDVSPEQFQEMWELNFLSAVRCTQAAAPHLLHVRGHVVNIGSLAAKTVSPYLGAYPATKFPLAAWSHQLRLEMAEALHVLLVCPGPLRRDDAGERYREEARDLPEAATKPGGGVKLKGIDPAWLAQRIVQACARRESELIVPWKARLLLSIAALSPAWGDWLIRRMTRS
jgi:short-subunit dehydrogenase